MQAATNLFTAAQTGPCFQKGLAPTATILTCPQHGITTLTRTIITGERSEQPLTFATEAPLDSRKHEGGCKPLQQALDVSDVGRCC